MKIDSLKNLYDSMREQKIDIQQFRIQTGVIEFDCLFSVREKPFLLTLTSRGKNPEFFKFEVHSGYQIDTTFDTNLYKKLTKLLRTDESSGNKLIPTEFLSQINNQIPNKATINNTPNRQEIVNLRHDIEERDKPYFDT